MDAKIQPLDKKISPSVRIANFISRYAPGPDQEFRRNIHV
ncbi:hypothetical protein TPY_0272 [Sulfobacillus acidophilus TPY]|nr:hypothetical protein TPY_0272 [Sulfobacillus acidophilus TPY]